MVEDIKKYCEQLGSKSPSPGGGSAVGIVLALSIACFKKAFSFSNKASNEILKEKIDALMKNSLKLAEDDYLYFLKWQEAKKMPKNTEDERNIREKEIIKYSDLCSIIPLECASESIVLLNMIEEFIDDCPPLLISDLGISLAFSESTFRSSKLNILINLNYIKDISLKNKLTLFLEENEEKFYNKSKSLQNQIEEKINKGK